MHELAITENLLEIALRHAEQADAKHITRLNLIIGDLSSIVDESVQFYWDIVSEGTIADGAELHFERVPGKMRCLSCDHTFPLSAKEFVCPACGASDVIVVGGDDFRLDSIEVED
jgi:hydrogenase nickel incorporation protein HypA/HybF